MHTSIFEPTTQQAALITHDGSAFVTACPGAGKTRCIVERARHSLRLQTNGRGIAFLSFTKAAISELEDRLRADGALPNPSFPHFVGTFDSFIWRFLVQPFGLFGCDHSLHLVQDIGDSIIKPYDKAHELPMKCFHRDTGEINPVLAKQFGFDTYQRSPKAHITAAQKRRRKQLKDGQVDFDDVRFVAKSYLENTWFSKKLGEVLSSRFQEIIVDEAQDCNPNDLAIVDWLQNTISIPTKVICDPNQSIYEFRGGVTQELLNFRDRTAARKMPVNGNWRSSANICKAVSALRAPSERGTADEALGQYRDLDIPVYILAYGGSAVFPLIGRSFHELIVENSLNPNECRIVSATKASSLKAAGELVTEPGKYLGLQLAEAVVRFHRGRTTADFLRAIENAHKVVLKIEGRLTGRTYHQAIIEEGLEPGQWRPEIIQMLNSLKPDEDGGEARELWIKRAQTYLLPKLPPNSGTIRQKLQNKAELTKILEGRPDVLVPSRTIHAVKGKEYPGICVVLTSKKANGVLTYLEEQPDESEAEEARKLYVGASRAEKLLAIACPNSRVKRLEALLNIFGSNIEKIEVPAAV